MSESTPGNRKAAGSRLKFRSAAAFVAEYIPLSYAIEGIVRSSSLYTLTARTGAGKTAFLIVAALAVATGRADIIGREVHHGRVAYVACENPDDIRMRLKIAAFLLNVDLDAIGDDLVIHDRRSKPEAVHAELEKLAGEKLFALVIVDTLAAFFDGDNINDNVQGGQFMRRLHPLTQIAGLPSVIVAAHPVKNASEEALVPYGGGAILSESVAVFLGLRATAAPRCERLEELREEAAAAGEGVRGRATRLRDRRRQAARPGTRISQPLSRGQNPTNHWSPAMRRNRPSLRSRLCASAARAARGRAARAAKRPTPNGYAPTLDSQSASNHCSDETPPCRCIGFLARRSHTRILLRSSVFPPFRFQSLLSTFPLLMLRCIFEDGVYV